MPNAQVPETGPGSLFLISLGQLRAAFLEKITKALVFSPHDPVAGNVALLQAAQLPGAGGLEGLELPHLPSTPHLQSSK